MPSREEMEGARSQKSVIKEITWGELEDKELEEE
jgi:hypothetical protein